MNDIIAKPTLETWKFIVNFDPDYLIYNWLHTKFTVTYKIANYWMPWGMKFNTKSFKRPERSNPEGQALVVILDRNGSGIDNSSSNDSNTGDLDSITVMDTTYTNGYLI